MMMRTYYIFCLLIVKVFSDDKIEYPKFPRQAQFILESFLNDGQHKRIIFECIYDYNDNYAIIISDQTFEYYNYTILKKATYSTDSSKQCQVYPIDIDNSLDGFSAIRNSYDNTTHIQLLNDFFLFPSNAIYLGEAIVRGYIHVNQWISSLSNDSDIIWSFAKTDYKMSWNSQHFTVPIQRIIKRKDDGLILQVLNVFSYKPIIIKTDLTPPTGIFCKDLIATNEFLSLTDIGIKFPKKFSIRIDAFTTSQQLWQSVHFHYYQTNEQKLIRYDYTPSDHNRNPLTIIFDYSANTSRSYKIDRRTGLCVINKTSDIIFLTSVLHNPIEFLIRYENLLFSNSPEHSFQYIGKRPCRGSILCEVYLGKMSLYPSDPEEDRLTTNIEWGWSKRDIINEDISYNYPTYLHLKFYKQMNEFPSDIHYEFYDYRTNVYLEEFDIDLCYRSNQLKYQHLIFQFKINNQSPTDTIENSNINRRYILESIHERMMNIMSITYLRISQIELDHYLKQLNSNDKLYCIFTLFDRIPFSDSNYEIGLDEAYHKLEKAINNNEFHIDIDERLSIEAVPGTLQDIQYFNEFNANISFNESDYMFDRTIVEKIEEIHEKVRHSIEIQAIAILSGLLGGILTGILIVFLVFYSVKRKVNMSSRNNIALRNISFRVNNTQKLEEPATVTMERRIHENQETFS